MRHISLPTKKDKIDKDFNRGFALPSVLIASIIMLTVLLASVSSAAAVRVSLMSQFYNQLAKDAGDAGIAYASACLAANNGVPLWTDAKPLKPNTDCSGNPISWFTCTDQSIDARCLVTVNGGSTIEVLVVGGGGGGNGGVSGVNWGNGGAGGTVVYQSTYPIKLGSKTVTVGGGGVGVITGNGGTGGNSVFDIITATGGTGTVNTSRSGGVNSMYQGGIGVDGVDSGGGAGGGEDGSVSTAGNGFQSNISGSNSYYGGGGGGVLSSVAQPGGLGGGGSAKTSGAGVNGGENTGGGGGGGNSAGAGGSGGSGIVIISYPTGSVTATGGTMTTSGGNTIHTFTNSGTFTVTSVNNISGSVTTTFSVGLPTMKNDKASEVTSTGTTSLIRNSDGTIWRKYNQTSRLILPS